MSWKSGELSAFLILFAIFVPASQAENRWTRLKSNNFELYSSASARSGRETVREFEQVRGFFQQAFGGPPADPMPVRLVAFGSMKEYEPYRLNEFAIAYYHSTPDRDYIVMGRSGSDTFPLAVHEYVHLLVRHSGLNLPPWLNEGYAELYSTLRPIGDKVLVGELIPGRRQALLTDKWVPLTTILAVDRSSPYYNEKNRASSLYNEGWALTHMLYFRADYRSGFSELLSSISGGEDSVHALERLYGRPLERIERDLRAYVAGNSFQGGLVAAKLDKLSGEIQDEPLADFDVRLMFVDLLSRPGNEAAQKAELERLEKDDPTRPEPHRQLGYVAWRGGQRDEAVRQFGEAFERHDRSPRMLWDYGRLLEWRQPERAVSVLSELLKQQESRIDVRLELAEIQVRMRRATAALATIAPIHMVPTEAGRYFRIAATAYLLSGDREKAQAEARRFQDIAKTAEDRVAAELLVSQAASPSHAVEPEPTKVAELPFQRR